jgi:hypothetical protein
VRAPKAVRQATVYCFEARYRPYDRSHVGAQLCVPSEAKSHATADGGCEEQQPRETTDGCASGSTGRRPVLPERLHARTCYEPRAEKDAHKEPQRRQRIPDKGGQPELADAPIADEDQHG